jgi:hypothetical protein
MAGPVPAIHVPILIKPASRDARDTRGPDGFERY